MNTEFQISPMLSAPGSANLLRYLRSTTYRIFHDATFLRSTLEPTLVRRDELLDWLEQQKVNKAQNENPKIVGSDE